MKQRVRRILRSARTASVYALRGTGYWIGGGIVGAPRPRLPRRRGYGPFKNAGRYAAAVAFYPLALCAWAGGTASRPLLRKHLVEVEDAATDVPQLAETVQHLALLGAAECADVVRRVHALRRMWVLRQPGFFTLGRAAYMDCGNPPAVERYLEQAKWLNEVLREEFAPLYEKLIAVLQEALGEPCRLTGQHAIPGFHIWLGQGIPHYGFDAGSVHFDLQYINLGMVAVGERWPRMEEVISFTLPVRLPQAGGGLNVWDVRHPERVGWEVWPFKKVSRVAYALGSLTLHTGHEMHQIAPIARVAEGDQRICLQGHGIRKDGGWLLYW
jgi:hypothetical protein